MNKRRKITFLTWTCMIVYICVFVLFVLNLVNFSGLYSKQEMKYIDEIELRIATLLNNPNLDTIEPALEELYSQYPLEIVVKNRNKLIYSSIPELGDRNMIGLLHKEAILIESQGNFGGYDIWYAIYNLPSQEFILPYLLMQSVLIIVAFSLLSFVIVLIRRGFKQPLTQIKESLHNIQEYNFAAIKPGSDDINYEMEKFSTNLEGNIDAVERKHTELETQLQIERERLNNTLTVSKSFIHDLKTPIHLVLMENQFYLSQMKSPSKEVEEITNITISKSKSTIQSINDILELMNHSNYGNQALVESFDLSKQFNESIKQFATAFKVNRFSAEIDIDPEIQVMMNKATFKLLVHNLISNMTRYAIPKTKLEINIRADETHVTLTFKNRSNSDNLQSMKKSEGIFNTLSVKGDKDEFSSGNGLFLIKDLSRMLNGTYNFNAESDVVAITIVLPRGVQDETANT